MNECVPDHTSSIPPSARVPTSSQPDGHLKTHVINSRDETCAKADMPSILLFTVALCTPKSYLIMDPWQTATLLLCWTNNQFVLQPHSKP